MCIRARFDHPGHINTGTGAHKHSYLSHAHITWELWETLRSLLAFHSSKPPSFVVGSSVCKGRVTLERTTTDNVNAPGASREPAKPEMLRREPEGSAWFTNHVT